MTSRFPLLLVALAALAGGLTGCDEGIGGTPETDQVFTLWGYLDPTADQQAIRVIPIADRIDAETPGVIDAEVSVTDMATNEVIPFRDSLVTYADGDQGFVFVANWTPGFSRDYRLTARRTADGAEATVDVRTPELVSTGLSDVTSSLTDVIYSFSFDGADNVFGVQVNLSVLGVPGTSPDTVVLEIPYPPGRSASGEDLDLPFVSTVVPFLNQRGYGGRVLSLVGVELVAFVANEDWDVPSGRFDDPDAIVEPGTVSNVEGGFGFVGSGYFTRTGWAPSPATAFRAGFAADGVGSEVRINEVSAEEGWIELYNPLDEVVTVGGYVVSTNPSGKGDQVTLPINTAIPARGFLAVDFPFSIPSLGTIYLLDGALREVGQRNLEDVPAGFSYGSYPDGQINVVRIGDDAQDLTGGELLPTRGQPNRPHIQLVALNEFLSTGDGWVEVIQVAGEGSPETSDEDFFVESAAVVTADPTDGLSSPQVALSGNGTFGVVEEGSSSRLSLEQEFGEIYLLVGYITREAPTDPPRYRVMDYHRYGIQVSGRSEGRIPDASGRWRRDLVPTRGAANQPNS